MTHTSVSEPAPPYADLEIDLSKRAEYVKGFY